MIVRVVTLIVKTYNSPGPTDGQKTANRLFVGSIPTGASLSVVAQLGNMDGNGGSFRRRVTSRAPRFKIGRSPGIAVLGQAWKWKSRPRCLGDFVIFRRE